MKTKITEKSKDLFISEKQSYRWYGIADACGNYEIVTRTKWVKVWKFWIPFSSEKIMVNVDNLLGYYALGQIADFNPCFDKEFKI